MRGDPRGQTAQTAATVDLEKPGHEDFLETLAEMERKVLLVPVESVAIQERWGGQVVKVRKVCQGLVDNLVQMGGLDQTDLKVLKVNQVHLDQDPKDFQERRGIQDVLDLRVQRGNQAMLETLVLQEAVAPVAPKDILDPQDAEVHLVLLVKRVVMVLQEKMALQDPPA